MNKKFLTIFAAMAIIFSSSANAAKIDVYRDAILNKSYTIKYEISQVPIYQNRRDASFSDEGLKERLTNFGKIPVRKGIVIEDGSNSYTETDFSPTLYKYSVNGKIYDHELSRDGVCKLIKDDKVFNFYYEMKKDKKIYYGGYSLFGKSHSIEEGDNRFQTPYQNLINDYTLGSAVLNDIFSPIIPPERLIATPFISTYQFVNSGTSKDGLAYEDFASNKNNIFSAIRYYFNGDDLVKVSKVSYLKNDSQLQSYEKFVVNITEFSTTPDKKYLSLPAELKVKAKKGAKKK